MCMWNQIQDSHGKRCIQEEEEKEEEEDSFHQQTVLKFEEETSIVLHLDNSCAENYATPENRS